MISLLVQNFFRKFPEGFAGALVLRSDPVKRAAHKLAPESASRSFMEKTQGVFQRMMGRPFVFAKLGHRGKVLDDFPVLWGEEVLQEECVNFERRSGVS